MTIDSNILAAGSMQMHWQTLKNAFMQRKFPQSMLFISPIVHSLNNYVMDIAHLLMCSTKQSQPCGRCTDCAMVGRLEHPDLVWVKPEKVGGTIKIEQIRAINQSAYLTPKRSEYRLIVIESADTMNTASANSLLKVLEEPASSVVFVLLAEQISSILPTILSRCAVSHFNEIENEFRDNLLKLGTLYPKDSSRALMVNDSATIIDTLIDLLNMRQNASAVASQWSKMEFSHLLWFLYLIYAEVQYLFIDPNRTSGPARAQLVMLSQLVSPYVLLKQMDIIRLLMNRLRHNVNMNATLALENLLLALVELSQLKQNAL